MAVPLARRMNPDRDIVSRLNERFAAAAGWAFDHRWFVVAASLVLVVVAGWLAGTARIDNSYEAYFDPTDRTYAAYEEYRYDFGSDEISYLLYAAPGFEHGPWNLEVMRKIADLTAALGDEVPFVYEVTSLANAELIRGVPDGIEIAKLRDEFPETQQEMLAVRDEYLAKPMLVGGILSADARYGAIVIEMDRSSTDPPERIQIDPEKGSDLENLYPQATDSVIEAILARPEYDGIDFYHSGDVPLNAAFNRVIGEESVRLDGLASAIIGLVLALFFRSFVGVLAPLLVVQVSVVVCVAFIALLDWKLDMSFGRMPALLIAIGVAHSVHILSEFRARFREFGDRRSALVETFRLVGAPCLMTSLTTAAGFASMSFVPIKSIAHYGVYGSFGVIVAFVMSVTLLTALLSFGRREPKRRTDLALTTAKGGALARRLLRSIAHFNIRNSGPILIAFSLVFVVSIAGISQLVVDSNWIDDFSDRMPIKAVTEKVDDVMGGVTNVIYLFDSGQEDGVKEPVFLREIERVQAIGEAQSGFVRKSYSILDILKDLNQAFHDGDPAYYRIPKSRELVAQYLLLYESSGGEEVEELVSFDYRRASLEFRLKATMVSETAALTERIDTSLVESPLDASEVSLTGIGALWLKLLEYIVSSQIQGFLLAFATIAVLMVTIFRSVQTGLISMLPNLAPVVLTVGAMGWLGIPLDYNKISIAGIAMGIAVDDTIHLISRYRYEFFRLGSYTLALEAALSDVGRALFITSVALVAGFLVFLSSVMASQATFGILLATTIVTALVADFLMMPALVLIFQPFGPEPERRPTPSARPRS